MKLVDLTGKRFKHLVVVARAESQRTPKTLITVWHVRCDCGRARTVSGNNLKRRKVQTCHDALCPYARAVSNHAGEGESAKRHVFTMYKGRAKFNKREFSLTKDEFNGLITSACFYCGDDPSNTSRRETGSGVFLYNGIDRIDSKIGYIKNNVRPCCWICNRMKNALSESQFIEHLSKICAHLQPVDSNS